MWARRAVPPRLLVLVPLYAFGLGPAGAAWEARVEREVTQEETRTEKLRDAAGRSAEVDGLKGDGIAPAKAERQPGSRGSAASSSSLLGARCSSFGGSRAGRGELIQKPRFYTSEDLPVGRVASRGDANRRSALSGGLDPQPRPDLDSFPGLESPPAQTGTIAAPQPTPARKPRFEHLRGLGPRSWPLPQRPPGPGLDPRDVGAGVIPVERLTAWDPGIPGGIPTYHTVCATIDASSYGNGTVDSTAGIQAAIDACPAGQVVQLSAGTFLVNGYHPIFVNKSIVLRGAGPRATLLTKSSMNDNPLVLIGERWNSEVASVNLTESAPRGARSVQVSDTAGFRVGQLVTLTELTDDSYVYWGTNPAAAEGGAARGWFTRYDRPVGQMLEVASVSDRIIGFTTPLHIAFDIARAPQLTRYSIPYGAKFAGVEDLQLHGGRDDNITLRLAMYSWVRNVESVNSLGDSVGLDRCFRCVVRNSYFHDSANPTPGGGGYLLALSTYTADSLVENSIFVGGNKVMVMRASGGGNVIGYNYFDDGYIDYNRGWMETGLNASHLACPHFELFEGNQAFNADGDDTWGGAVYITFFRNHLTGKRRSFDDVSNRRAIGLMYGHYYYSFVGNVLGTPDQDPAPFSGFAYEDDYPWESDPIGLWRIGYAPGDWNAPPDPRVVGTLHRHANFDYATHSIMWATGWSDTLPDSLYLASKPAFFGAYLWPWVDATGATNLHTLPARARFEAGGW